MRRFRIAGSREIGVLRGAVTSGTVGKRAASVPDNSGQRDDLAGSRVVLVDIDIAAFEEVLDLMAPADREEPRLEVAVPPAAEFLEIEAVRIRASAADEEFGGHDKQREESTRGRVGVPPVICLCL